MSLRIWFVLARAGMAAVFLWNGAGKMFAQEGMAAYIASAGMPLPHVALWGAIFLELGAGLALLVGFRLAWSAGVLALFCVLTAFVFHTNFADENELTHFLKNFAIAGGLGHLALAAREPALRPLLRFKTA